MIKNEKKVSAMCTNRLSAFCWTYSFVPENRYKVSFCGAIVHFSHAHYFV